MSEFNKYNFVQERNDYLTPPEIIEPIFQMLNDLGIQCSNKKFQLDVCCSKKNIPAWEHYIDGEKDGLNEEWKFLNYCNPPYKYCDKWVKKAFQEFQNGNVSVLLIPARTETKYWQEYILKDGFVTRKNVHVKFLRKGLCFLNPDTNEQMGVFKNALAIVIFDGMREKGVLFNE